MPKAADRSQTSEPVSGMGTSPSVSILGGQEKKGGRIRGKREKKMETFIHGKTQRSEMADL